MQDEAPSQASAVSARRGKEVDRRSATVGIALFLVIFAANVTSNVLDAWWPFAAGLAFDVVVLLIVVARMAKRNERTIVAEIRHANRVAFSRLSRPSRSR